MRTKHRSRRTALAGRFTSLIVLPLAVLAAACGSDDSDNVENQATDSVVEVDSSTGAETVETETSGLRIMSLSPAHTEILWAMGAGDDVVAVDSLSTFPAETASVVTDISAYEPNVEVIAEYEPDVVVIGDDFLGLAEQLAAIGIDAWTSPAPVNLDEVYGQIVDLGTKVGHAEGAEELVASMASDLEAIVAEAPTFDEPLTYFHELDDTLYSVTSGTFIGAIYELFGLRNIADATESDTAFPQLSAEFIVSEDPDLIFLADTKCCGASAESVAARPGWGALSAVSNGYVFAMDDDIASRPGPRLVDYARAVAEALSGLGN